jgi:hypothetical protein
MTKEIPLFPDWIVTDISSEEDVEIEFVRTYESNLKNRRDEDLIPIMLCVVKYTWDTEEEFKVKDRLYLSEWVVDNNSYRNTLNFYKLRDMIEKINND